MGIFIGSDGLLFACPDTSSVSQIPQIHTERSSVPVQGTPIRPLDKSFRVYTPYDRHRDIPKEKGDNSTSLSRQLVGSKPKPSKTVGTQTIHFVADQLTRSDHQLREIRPSSSLSVHIHRDGVSDSYQYCHGTSDQANEGIGDSQNVFSENLCISQRFPVPLETTECCSRPCNHAWVKVFRFIPEFRFLDLARHRFCETCKSGEILGGWGIGPLTMKTVGDLNGQSQNIADNFPESLAVNPVYL